MADASVRPIRDSAGRITGYQVRWREGAKRPGRSFGPDEKPLAERFAAERRAVQGGKTRKPRKSTRKPAGRTLADYFVKGYATKITLSRKTQKKTSPSTLATRESVWTAWVQPHLGARPLRAITPADVEAFYKKITHTGRDADGNFLLDEDGEPILPHPGWTNGLDTARKCRALLRDLFFYAKRDGLVMSDPTAEAYIELPSDTPLAPRVDLTDDEVSDLIGAVPRHFRTLITLQATIGLRLGEAAALQVRDFDSKKDQLTVARSLSTRSKRLQGGSSAVLLSTKTKAGNRRINLPTWLADELRTQCAGRKPTDPMFTSTTGCILLPHNFRSRIWNATRDALGLDPSLTPHDLRHYAATRLLSEGVDVQEVCDMLGHQHVGVTDMLYRHVRPERRRGIAQYWEEVGRPGE
jgi:integrase